MCLHKCHGHTSVFMLVMWSASELLIRNASRYALGTQFLNFGQQLLQLHVQLGDAYMSRQLLNFLHVCENKVNRAHNGCWRKMTVTVCVFLSGWKITFHHCHDVSPFENQSWVTFLLLQATPVRQSQRAIQEKIFKDLLLQYLPHDAFAAL